MAQDGDTITYTYSDATSVAEDVSAVGEAVVEYCDGPGGVTFDSAPGEGGRVENATIDVSEYSTLYIWVGGIEGGRYSGFGGAGSSEISFSNTTQDDSDDEPFLVGAGSGGSGGYTNAYGGSSNGYAGARNDLYASGTEPPLGGEPGYGDSSPGGDGDGAIDDQNRGLVSGGTTILGGGAGADTDGEIQITYNSLNSPPSFSSGSESPSDGATGIGFDPTLSIEVTDPDGDSMSVTFRDDSDGSKIGSTQTGIADGETASVTWSERDFGTTYDWYAVADDGSATTQSSTFSFKTGVAVPANVTVSEDTVEGELTISWDAIQGVSGYYVYRAESSGSTKADYTQVADVISPPYTDQNLEDGEQYYYRIIAYVYKG